MGENCPDRLALGSRQLHVVLVYSHARLCRALSGGLLVSDVGFAEAATSFWLAGCLETFFLD